MPRFVLFSFELLGKRSERAIPHEKEDGAANKSYNNMPAEKTKSSVKDSTARFLGVVGLLVDLIIGGIAVLSFYKSEETREKLETTEVTTLLHDARDLMEGRKGAITISLPNIHSAEQRDRFELARRKIDTALALKPNLQEARRLRSVYLKIVGKLDEALKEGQRTVQLDPACAAAHNTLGTIYSARGENDKAIASYERSIKLDPGDVRPHNNLGLALTERAISSKNKGDEERALRILKAAIDLDKSSAIGYSNRCATLLDFKRFDEAEADCRKAISLDGELFDSHFNLAVVLMRQHELRPDLAKVKGAVAEFEKAVVLDPSFTEARERLEAARTMAAQVLPAKTGST